MKLKTIKEKSGNQEYNELMSKTVSLIEDTLNLNLKYNNLFFLEWFNSAMFFLYQNTVIVVSVEYEITTKAKPLYETTYLSELYTVKLLKNYPKTKEDIWFKTIINKSGVHWFSAEKFLNWIDEPSQISTEMDEPYYKVISYLQKYSKETFSTERYNFFSKWDNDSNFITNIYAYDKKNHTELKLYIPNKCEKINDEWVYIVPQNINDVVVEVIASDDVSNYQKRVCKKAFLEIANQENSYFKTKNYWVMELVKKTIQPTDELHEWSCHRCFCKPKLFGHIWVQDYLNKDNEPYFFITDSSYLGDTTKVAVLNLKNPKYYEKGIYKRNNVKRKSWKLNEQEIKELINFLKQPSEYADVYGKGKVYDGYKKYVKTNWQQLIFEYNHNTAGWGCGDNGFDIPPETDKDTNYEALSFDLPIPDYAKLLNDKG